MTLQFTFSPDEVTRCAVIETISGSPGLFQFIWHAETCAPQAKDAIAAQAMTFRLSIVSNLLNSPLLEE